MIMDTTTPLTPSFLNWQQTKVLEPLNNGERLNKSACSRLLDDFLKLLEWYFHHKGTLDDVVVSQVLCYTDRLLEMFHNSSFFAQLQASKLLCETNGMKILSYVMRISPNAFANDAAATVTNKEVFTSCVLLLQCVMLNCMTVLPASEVTRENQHLLLSLLYEHLESIPQLENPQNMVKLVGIQTVLSTIYCQLKDRPSIDCIPGQECISAIVKVTSYPVQMVKILAKAVLSLLSLGLVNIPEESLVLDDIEIQTFLNCLQGEPRLSKAMVLPMSKYMEDVIMASSNNRVAFMQCNVPMLLTMFKQKHEDPAVLEMFDRLNLLLTKYEHPSSLKDAGNTKHHDGTAEPAVDSDDVASNVELEPVEAFPHLTQESFKYFDLFNCLMKHFPVSAQNTLAADLTPFAINNITTIVGFIRHMLTRDEEICSKIFASLAGNSHFMSLMYQLLQKWPELIDGFPLFGNAIYGLLISGSNDDKFCFELGRSGLLYWMLSFLYAVTKIDLFQFGDVGNLIALLVIIFNCAQRPQVIPALELVSTVNILQLYTHCPDVRIAMLAKFTLSFMDFAVQDCHVLDLNDKEMNYISDQLSEAVAGGSTSHWYMDTELLLVLTNLTRSPYFTRNLFHILQGKASIVESAMKLMQSSKTSVQKAALRFLLNLYSVSERPPCLEQIHAGKSSLVEATLEKLMSSVDAEIQELANCAQLLTKRDITRSSDEVSCIQSCYKANLYDKCAKLCTSMQISSKPEVCLLKAKVLFHLYRREQKYLRRHISSLNQQDADQKTASCYSKAEECIKLLGKAHDNQAIDSEGSKMLDQCILDYIRETNEMNKLKRCLLCRNKTKLKRSHLWPRSFLRRYTSSQEQNVSSKIFISFTSEKPRQKSAGELTYWMLCGKCEQILSQNGEDKFSKELFDVITSTSDSKDAEVPYGPWLYNFSIGLLFRTFLFFSLTSVETHSIFLRCREHLRRLPVKYEEMCESNSVIGKQQQVEEIPSLGQQEAEALISRQQSQQSFEEIRFGTTTDKLAGGDSKMKGHIPLFILINPTKLDVDHPRKSMLIRALFDAGSTLMSDVSLKTGKHDLSGQHHFIVIRLGNLNILLQLDASTDYCPPLGSEISPDGGKLFVPAEKGRWDYIPEGLWVQIDKMAKIIEEATLRHYAYKSKGGNWKASDSPEMQQLPSNSEEFAEQERMLHRHLKESSDTPQSSFIARFLHNAQPSLSFLPEEIKIAQKHSYTQKGYIQLPDSHVIFCHGTFTFTEAAMTVFLAAYYEENSSDLKVYVIIVERIQGVQLAYGAYVDTDTNPLRVTKPLVDINKYSEHHQARFHHYCEVMEEVFLPFLKFNRFDNLDMVIQRAKCTRLRKSLMSFGPLDFKCKDGCWYCEDRCHHCLQPATVGYSLRTVERQILKFCKVNPCYSFYVPLPESPPTFILPLPHASSDSSDSELLIQIVKVISTGWSSKTVAIVHLCIVPGTNKRQLYVLTHFRTAGSHAFFDFLISENYEPLNTMWYMKHKHSIIMSNRALFMLMIKMIVEDALQATSYQNLQGLLSAHQVAALTDTKKEHCQPDTNKSEKDTFTGDVSCLFQEAEAAK